VSKALTRRGHHEPGLYLTFKRIPNGWRASLHLKLNNNTTSDITVSGNADDDDGSASQALHRAVAAANQVMQSPALVALMPPQVTLALQATREIARAGKRQVLDKVINGKKLWDHFTGVFHDLARGLSDVAHGRGGGAVMGGDRVQLVDRTGCMGSRITDHRKNAGPLGNFGRFVAPPAHGASGTRGPAGMQPLPGFPPYGSPPFSQNPYAQNPWAPFAQPNAWQTPNMQVPPPPTYPAPPPPDMSTPEGVPPPMTDAEYEAAFGLNPDGLDPAGM